jgi:TldD protein
MNQSKDINPCTRRQFIKTSVAGTGMLFVPSFLFGCRAPLKPHAAAAYNECTASYFSNYGVDEAVIRTVLDAAMDKGGEFADLFFQYKMSNYLGLEDGEVNRAFSDIILGCGIRVIKADQTGFAFTEDLSTKALISTAKTAAMVSNGASSQPMEAMTVKDVPRHYPIEIPFSEVGIDAKMPFATQADKTARAVDKRIVKVRVLISDYTEHVLIASSDGRIAEDFRPMTECSLACVAVDAGRTEHNGWAFGLRKGFEQYTKECIEELARTAANRTVVLFEAAPPPVGEYPVVLAPGLSGLLLHEAIGHGMEADFNRKGTSIYTDRIGTKVAPEFVSIVDDATNLNERGSLNIDDEGVPGQRTVLVENGILKGFLHDRISAKYFDVAPTGNGRRQDYKFPAVPRMCNTYMLNGPHSPEEIVASVKKGIYAEGFDNGQVNIGSGDFAFYLKNGYLIEDGKLTRPVKDANMMGFGPKVLEQMEMVGNDSCLYSGTGMCGKDGQIVPIGMGLPTVKCKGISIGGRG